MGVYATSETRFLFIRYYGDHLHGKIGKLNVGQGNLVHLGK